MSVRTTDRELLLVLKTKLDSIGESLKLIVNRLDKVEDGEISEDRIKNLEKYVYDLQKDKLDKIVFDKSDASALEKRIRTLENFRWWIVGTSAGAGFIGNLIGKWIFK